MQAPSGAERPGATDGNPPAAQGRSRCPSVRAATTFYRNAYISWRLRMGAPISFQVRDPGCSRHVMWVAVTKAKTARRHYRRWLSERTLRDFAFCEGCRAWPRAVEEVQRVFPGTESWLLSCSAAEGGHGRWVGYSGVSYSTWLRDSDTVGGPLQFRFSTFTGMYRRAVEYARDRGYRVPSVDMTSAWRSALGQALAGGWARFTGNDNYHWSASFGRGC